MPTRFDDAEYTDAVVAALKSWEHPGAHPNEERDMRESQLLDEIGRGGRVVAAEIDYLSHTQLGTGFAVGCRIGRESDHALLFLFDAKHCRTNLWWRDRAPDIRMTCFLDLRTEMRWASMT